MDESTVLMRCVSLEDAGDHLQTGIPQTLNATTSHTRIRIFECHNHALNAGLNHSLRAGGGAALMTTGLECDDDRAALGAPTGLGKRTHLGMSLTRLGVKSFTHQRSLSIQHHCTHQGIGAGLAFRQGSKLQRAAHPKRPAVGAGLHQLRGWVCTSRHSPTT
jgi:hypothetical protein